MNLHRFLQDRRALTGAEKALLICTGLGVILGVSSAVRSGAERAASDARRALEGEQASGALGSVGAVQVSAGLPSGGDVTPSRSIEPIHSTDPTDARLVYQGGKVVSSPKVVAVFWENGSNTVSDTVKSQIGGFYQAVTSSSYIDWLSEYNTPTQKIGRGSYAGSVTINPQSGNSISNADIQAEINRQIDSGALPPPDANTIYMISFPPQVSIDLDGEKSCQAFCAYHNTLVRDGQSVYYGVLPDVGPGSQCANGCGGSSNSFDNQTSVASHELIETVTDPDVGIASTDQSKLGWYDQKYGEIGDICNAQQGSLPGTSYTVQQEWSNQEGRCIVARSAGVNAMARR